MKYLISSICILSLSLASFGQLIQGNDGLYYDKHDIPYTGTYKEYYKDSTLRTEMKITDGMKDGAVMIYYPNGKIHEIRNYARDKMDGKWETWNEKGIKTAEANYANDQKHGKWFIWDDNGVLRYDMTYDHGKKCGIWKIFDASGKLVNEKDFGKVPEQTHP